MAPALLTLGSLVVLLVVLASILGAVPRRERFAFVLGIAAFVAVHVAPGTPEAAGTVLAVVGLAVAIAATVPMLREPI